MSVILQLMIGKSCPVLRGRDHYWSVIMDFAMREETFIARDVFGKSNVPDSGDIRAFLKCLTLAGYVESTGENPVSYRVIKKQAATPRVRPDGSVIEGVGRNQAMWNLMRGPVGRSGFSADDLVQKASTDEVKISVDCAKRYIKRLDDAGYLVLRQKGGKHRPPEWRLLPHMMTGPDAPKVLKSRMVYDPNRQQMVGEVLAEEEQS